MSQSTSSSSFMLLVDLNELNEPHKLAKWFTILPIYKKSYLQSISTPNIINKPSLLTPINSNIDDEDINICQLLSKFVYQNQICGKHLKYNFVEQEFKIILNTIFNDTNYTYSEYEWLWDIIKQSQSINNNIEQNIYKVNEPKIPWILSSWNQFQLIQQDEIYHNPTSYNNKPSKSMEIKSSSTKNGKYSITTEQYETKQVESNEIDNHDHSTNNIHNNNKDAKSENNEESHPIPAFKQLDDTENDNITINANRSNDTTDTPTNQHDAEFTPRKKYTYTSSDDKLDHHEDEQYEQSIAKETDDLLVKTDSDTDRSKHIKKPPQYKGNRQRLGTESFTESDDLEFGKTVSSKNRTRELNKTIYHVINENEQDTDSIDHGRTNVETPNGTQTNSNERVPKGVCDRCIIL